MDISALASALTTVLGPVLPYLLKAGENVAEEIGKARGRAGNGPSQSVPN